MTGTHRTGPVSTSATAGELVALLSSPEAESCGVPVLQLFEVCFLQLIPLSQMTRSLSQMVWILENGVTLSLNKTAR